MFSFFCVFIFVNVFNVTSWLGSVQKPGNNFEENPIEESGDQDDQDRRVVELFRPELSQRKSGVSAVPASFGSWLTSPEVPPQLSL